MAIYVYKCVACGRVEELDLSMGYQPSVLTCPDCDKPMRRRYGKINTGHMQTNAGSRMGKSSYA